MLIVWETEEELWLRVERFEHSYYCISREDEEERKTVCRSLGKRQEAERGMQEHSEEHRW
jgi:hypothetical protein